MKYFFSGVVPIGTYGNGIGTLKEDWSTEDYSGVNSPDELKRIRDVVLPI